MKDPPTPVPSCRLQPRREPQGQLADLGELRELEPLVPLCPSPALLPSMLPTPPWACAWLLSGGGTLHADPPPHASSHRPLPP